MLAAFRDFRELGFIGPSLAHLAAFATRFCCSPCPRRARAASLANLGLASSTWSAKSSEAHSDHFFESMPVETGVGSRCALGLFVVCGNVALRPRLT